MIILDELNYARNKLISSPPRYPVKTHILDSPDPNLSSGSTVLYTHVSDIGQIMYTQFRNCIEPMYLRCLIGLERDPVNSFFHLATYNAKAM